jgi:copper oxidase (laccase) domain-containing protein
LDPKKKVIANVHCGWKGNALNILGSALGRMISDFGSRVSDIKAAVGPSLGPCCAEFVTYEQIFPREFSRFMVRKNYFDLWEISRWQLMEAGIEGENIEIAGICTRCRTDLFYSYRAEGITGRFATVVMLK